MTACRLRVDVMIALCAVAVLMASGAADASGAVRAKRQLPPIQEGNQVIDDIFQIPIGTLNAVGSLIKSARPLVRRTRERIQQYYYNGGNGQPASPYQQQRPQYAYQQQRPQYAYQQNGNRRPYHYNGNRNGRQRDEPPAQGRRGRADDY